MKSKSLPIGRSHDDSGRQNRVFDFVQLYKKSSNSGASSSGMDDSRHSAGHNVKSESTKRERSPHKHKKTGIREPIDVSVINAPGLIDSSMSGTSLSLPRVTSTPLADKQKGKSNKVKSIMKNSSVVTNETTVETNLDSSDTKPKKRNKSVSFMLEDNEEVCNKKTKSDSSTDNSKSDTTHLVKGFKVNRKFKKSKTDKLSEKENLAELNLQTVGTDNSVKEKRIKMVGGTSEHPEILHLYPDSLGDNHGQIQNVCLFKKKQKKPKKVKGIKTTETEQSKITENPGQESSEKLKKPKKKKHQDKSPAERECDEPASKSRKKDSKPDVVTELEQLSIGDNAHTLSNLLDEMTVVDKEKRKKLKHKSNKNKKPKATVTPEPNVSTDEIQEKVKWMRRKWNKEHKTDINNSLDTTIIVENVPLSLLLTYKKVLAEHYVKYGLIKSVGIAEVYPTKVSEPVFTTSVNFYSNGAAAQALEDAWVLDGRRVSVKRALPPADTTVVVRSYAPLSAAGVGSALHAAGPIRAIRQALKGKHSMATFFVEFDGPDSVEAAIKLTADAKIGGKKVYVSKFEVRTKKNKQHRTNNNEASDADQSDDCQE